MDFDEKHHDIILLLLVASGITNILSILLKSRWYFVCVKPWLRSRSTTSAHYNIMRELKLQDHYDYRKYFVMNCETRLISYLQFNVT